MKHLLTAALFFAWIAPLGAAQAVPPETSPQARAAAPLALCPPEVRLAQLSQTECCKGHKGVCGCRAGRIVCCDNTPSAHCTCHGESGVEN